MSDKLVTLNQVRSVQQMANEKRVGRVRFQKALDDGRAASFLDDLKSDEILPPEGTRIHILRVKVKLDQPWQEAVNAAGPDTPSHYNVRKVGDLYVPTGFGEEEQEHVLLNFPAGDGSWDKALMWAETKGLKRTVPREVFAIGKQYPELHRTLGINSLYIVSTKECTFEGDRRACCVWWSDAGREACLFWVSDFGGAGAWFAFRKTLALDT